MQIVFHRSYPHVRFENILWSFHLTSPRQPIAVRKIRFHLQAETPSLIRGVRGDRLHPNRVERQFILKHSKERLCLPFPSLIACSIE
ncbi:hypothetical protein TNCV_4868221 [Trichonephila clavipes]|nr:hypothetical protein TNCV_4868221 [Trichonephila clavipes]